MMLLTARPISTGAEAFCALHVCEKRGANFDSPISTVPKRDLQRASFTLDLRAFQRRGAIAQLGERLHGMQEVAGSIPAGSTNFRKNFGRRIKASFKTGRLSTKSISVKAKVLQCPHRLEA